MGLTRATARNRWAKCDGLMPVWRASCGDVQLVRVVLAHEAHHVQDAAGVGRWPHAGADRRRGVGAQQPVQDLVDDQRCQQLAVQGIGHRSQQAFQGVGEARRRRPSGRRASTRARSVPPASASASSARATRSGPKHRLSPT